MRKDLRQNATKDKVDSEVDEDEGPNLIDEVSDSLLFAQMKIYE